MSKHILKIREYNRTTKETLKEWEETFLNFYNAERRKNDLEWVNSDNGSQKRVKATLVRNTTQKEVKVEKILSR